MKKTEPLNDLRLYLHIPFCVRKCNYCDFVSFSGKEAVFADYVNALCNEIRMSGKLFPQRKVLSVFIGGGTPSILDAGQMEQIISVLTDTFQIKGTREKRRGLRLQKKIRPETEVTIECNPGTVDKKKIKAYKSMGINRISFGLQSTDRQELESLGRIHTYEEFEESFEMAREAGFDNLNVDLMQAVPGQTLESWKKSLAIVSMWKPEHISAYSLIIEEGTPFHEQFEKGILQLPDEDTEREIYYYTREFLEKSGYRRYEISNYAVPGFACEHNCGYWRREPYLGLGLNASSMVDNVRWKNTADLSAYLKAFSDAAHPEDVTEERHTLSHKEQMEEFMFLGLRMSRGISKQDFFDSFGQDFDFTYGEVVYDLKQKELLDTDGDRVFLTDRGIDLSNTALAEFLL